MPFTIDRVITKKNLSLVLLSGEPSQTSAQTPLGNYQAHLTIHPTQTKQQIEGFGAAMTESSAIVLTSLPEENRIELMDMLFNPSRLGLSYIRLPMGASDFSMNNYSYAETPNDENLDHFSIARDQETIIPRLQEAIQYFPTLNIMGSPWSAPSWMKTTNSMNGGSLKQEYLEVYANYFIKFLQAYKNEGIPIRSITMQNEPLHETTQYPTMLMNANQQIQLTKILGPKLNENDFSSVDLIGFDHNWDLGNYALQIMSDPVARNYLAGVAYHCYGGSFESQSTFQNFYPDKGIWFSECSGGGWATDWGSNLLWFAENLFIGSMNHGSKAVMLWNLALDEDGGPKNGGCQNCRGVVTVRKDGTYVLNEESVILQHFAPYLRPGSFVIEHHLQASSQTTLRIGTYLNTQGEMLVVVMNKGIAQDLLITIGNQKQIVKIETDSVTTFIFKEIV
jgi:glucosylceramidase